MTIARFREHDQALLKKQHAIYQDESKLVQTSREASEELLILYESDREPDARAVRQ